MQKSEQKKSTAESSDALLETNIDIDVQTLTAKLDIPFLFGAQFREESTKALNQQMIIYETDIAYETILNFYQTEMARSGWQFLSMIQSHESLLIFKKPYTMAVISIRPVHSYFGNGSHTIVIAITPLEEVEE